MLDYIMGGWLAPYLSIALPATTNKKINQYKNKQTFQNVFVQNMLTALQRYDIEGVPDTCDRRVVLQSLLWYGNVLFFRRDGNVYALPCVNTSEGYTVYGYWRAANWIGLNGMSERVPLKIPGGTSFLRKIVSGERTVKTDEAVLVRENPLMYPFVQYVWQYSDYMSDTLRTLDTARMHLKHPYVVTAEQSVVNTVKGWLKDTKDNQDALISTGIFPSDKVTIQDLSVTGDNVNAVRALYEWYESQYFGLCGIAHNTGSDKKGENLITAEIGIDEESDSVNIDSRLDCIRQDLTTVNETFGTNIRVVTDRNRPTGGDIDGMDSTVTDDDRVDSGEH